MIKIAITYVKLYSSLCLEKIPVKNTNVDRIDGLNRLGKQIYFLPLILNRVSALHAQLIDHNQNTKFRGNRKQKKKLNI